MLSERLISKIMAGATHIVRNGDAEQTYPGEWGRTSLSRENVFSINLKPYNVKEHSSFIGSIKYDRV